MAAYGGHFDRTQTWWEHGAKEFFTYVARAQHLLQQGKFVADVLLCTGPVTRFMEPKLRQIYAQIPDPKVVIAVGNCATSGDVFFKSYNLVGPVDRIIPVDVYVHGCAIRPEALIEGVAKAVTLLEAKRAALLNKPAAGEGA